MRNVVTTAPQTNPIQESGLDASMVDYKAGVFQLADRDIVRFARVRLIGWTREFPFWDVSYVWGWHRDGRLVQVDLGSHQLRDRTARGTGYTAAVVRLCQEANRYGVGMGLHEALSVMAG